MDSRQDERLDAISRGLEQVTPYLEEYVKFLDWTWFIPLPESLLKRIWRLVKRGKTVIR